MLRNPTAPTIPTTPAASAAPETPNPSTAASQAAPSAQPLKASAFAGSSPLAAADDASQAAASAVPTAKAFAQAAKSAVAGDSGDSNPKPLAADKAASGNLPVQPVPVGADDSKPASSGNPAVVAVLATKAAPGSHAPSAASANQDLAAAVAKDVSVTPGSAQPAAIPESLRTLVSSLDPASAQVQMPGTSASTQSMPATSAAIAITTRVDEGSRQFDIRLDPPELGRIDVHLDVDKDGGVSTRLTVDRPRIKPARHGLHAVYRHRHRRRSQRIAADAAGGLERIPDLRRQRNSEAKFLLGVPHSRKLSADCRGFSLSAVKNRRKSLSL
jgi:flagellar hook-length control protein FliK